MCKHSIKHDKAGMISFKSWESYHSSFNLKHSDFRNRFFYLRLFLGDLHYFIVTSHWMCTNVQRPLRSSSSLLLSKGTPRVPRPEIEPRTYRMAGRCANQWATPHPSIELCLTPIELHLTPIDLRLTQSYFIKGCLNSCAQLQQAVEILGTFKGLHYCTI